MAENQAVGSTEGEPPLPLDKAAAATLRRLAFIRYLYWLGLERSRAAEPLNNAGLLHFHDSVELFLGLVAELLNAGAKRDTQFMRYFDLIAARRSPGLHHRDAMQQLNLARVELKHRGVEVSAVAMVRYREGVELFFIDNMRMVFGTTLEAVSLASLVQDAEVREALECAERVWAEGRREEANKQLAIAFTIALYRRPLGSRWQGPVASFLRTSPTDEIREVAEVLERLAQEINQLRIEVGLLRGGVDTEKLAHFRQLTPLVFYRYDGSLSIDRDGPAVTEHDVRFCYDFVVDTLLTLQTRANRVQGLATKPEDL